MSETKAPLSGIMVMSPMLSSCLNASLTGVLLTENRSAIAWVLILSPGIKRPVIIDFFISFAITFRASEI